MAERNAALLAQQPVRRRGVRTPEIIFTRHIDNSRLVKASDPVRVRQMRIFSAAVTVLFSLIMIYGLQHFSAIEGLLPRRIGEAGTRSVARRQPPAAPLGSTAHAARPH